MGQYAPVVVTGSRTNPSIWSGDTPASAIVRRARMLQAPTRSRVCHPSAGPLASVRHRRPRPCLDVPTALIPQWCDTGAGGCWGVIVRSFLRAFCGPGRSEGLADDPPLGDLGRWPSSRISLRHGPPRGPHLPAFPGDGSTSGSRVLVQHNHRDVERLGLLQQSDRTVIHHAVVVDRAPSTHLLPRQMIPSHSAGTSAPGDAAADCRRDSAGSPAAPRWRRPRRAASRHRAPHLLCHTSLRLDSVENVME